MMPNWSDPQYRNNWGSMDPGWRQSIRNQPTRIALFFGPGTPGTDANGWATVEGNGTTWRAVGPGIQVSSQYYGGRPGSSLEGYISIANNPRGEMVYDMQAYNAALNGQPVVFETAAAAEAAGAPISAAPTFRPTIAGPGVMSDTEQPVRRKALLKALLVDTPPITAMASAVTSLTADWGGAGADAGDIADFANFTAALGQFLGVNAYQGNETLISLFGSDRRSTADLLTSLGALNAPIAVQRLMAAVNTFNTAQAAAADDTALGDACAPLFTAMGEFAGAIAPPLSGGGSSLASNPLALLLLLDQGNGGGLGIGQGPLLSMLITGPAITAFVEACDDAATAFAASTTDAGNVAALAAWASAAATYFAALSQAVLFGALL